MPGPPDVSGRFMTSHCLSATRRRMRHCAHADTTACRADRDDRQGSAPPPFCRPARRAGDAGRLARLHPRACGPSGANPMAAGRRSPAVRDRGDPRRDAGERGRRPAQHPGGDRRADPRAPGAATRTPRAAGRRRAGARADAHAGRGGDVLRTHGGQCPRRADRTRDPSREGLRGTGLLPGGCPRAPS